MLTTRQTADHAEDSVCRYLTARGHMIIERNWRARTCEIDIVSSLNRILYFTEVKFRSSHLQGSGLEYVTPQKVRRMAYGASLFVDQHKWRGEYCLCAAEVSGADYADVRVVKIDSL